MSHSVSVRPLSGKVDRRLAENRERVNVGSFRHQIFDEVMGGPGRLES